MLVLRRHLAVLQREGQQDIQKHALWTQHSFGSGDTISQLAFDTVDVGPLEAKHQYFWEVTAASLDVGHGFQAIIGIGPPNSPRQDAEDRIQGAELATASLAAQGSKKAQDSLLLLTEKSLLENLALQTFSVCLGREERSNGVIVWGDSAFESEEGLFTKVPVDAHFYWGVRATSFGFSAPGAPDRVDLGCEDHCAAIVDSGTSLISVPSALAKRAASTIARTGHDCSRLDELPDLVFELGGQQMRLPPDSYVGEVFGVVPAHLRAFALEHNLPLVESRCELLLMSADVQTDHGPLIILGMPFFREYYTTFDLGQDPMDPKQRSLHLSVPGERCEPAATPSSRSQRSQSLVRSGAKGRLRRVNLSELRVPGWVVAAAKRGTLSI